MRRLLSGILVVGLLLGMVGNSFALSKEYTRGAVVSVDYKKSEVVIVDDTTKMQRRFTAKKIEPGVTEGVRVLVIYKPGTTQATLVKPTKK